MTPHQPPRAQRHLRLRYQIEEDTKDIVHDFKQRLDTIFGRQVNRVHVLDFAGLMEEMRQAFTNRIKMVYIRLHIAEEMAEDGFEAYWLGSTRVTPDKGDLRDYWTEISSDRDFLGPAPSYTFIRDLVRMLCYRLISYIIYGRGQAPEKGRKSEVRMSGGYFIGRRAKHFSLVSDEGLMGLYVIARVLPDIDLDELGKLNICGALDVDEDAQAVPAPVQAPQPPSAAALAKTMTQRLSRLEEEVHSLHGDMGEQREVVDSMAREFS
ncbi:hypothetical protein Tco_1521456 [Tanacetum coccineum]